MSLDNQTAHAHISTPNETNSSKPLPIAVRLTGELPHLIGLANEPQRLAEGSRSSPVVPRTKQRGGARLPRKLASPCRTTPPMTAVEQLAVWAAAPNDEVFVGLQFPQSDAIFTVGGGNSSADNPCVVGRIKAKDALARLFPEKGAAPNSMARDVLARFLKRDDAANSIEVGEIKGVTCVIAEVRLPVAPHAPFRLLLSPVEAFS